jgi:subtilase family serine protease
VTQNQYHVPAFGGRDRFSAIPAQTVHGIAQSPRLPYRLSNFVLAILGLTNYSTYASQLAHLNPSYVRPQAGSSNSCVSLTGVPSSCRLPSDFAAGYHLSGLYGRGANGAGQTLAVVNLAAVDPGAPQYFWSNIAHVPDTGRTLTVQNIDGGPGAPGAPYSIETDLDLEQAGAVAPGANVIDYQAPNTDYGFADAFFAVASQDVASTVSSSFVESETLLVAAILGGQEAATYNAAFDEAFLEMAVQGQSGFISSGDAGAYAARNDIGTTDLSVQSNSDSPFITATGGTTLPWTGTLTGPAGSATVSVTAERAWSWDYVWPTVAKVNGESEAAAAESPIYGGGGGFSPLYPTPLYQQLVPGTHTYHAIEHLTPTGYQTITANLVEPTAWTFNPAPPVTSGSGNGRAVPDLSADADPYTGYQLYSPSLTQIGFPVLAGGFGGTSIVAPQMAGAAAVIDSYLGHRVGFWNPVIYAASVRPGSPFTQLSTAGTSNDNLYYTGNPGDPYNPAVGLGVPNLTALAGVFGESS